MSKGWDGIISQHVNRRFSRPIARFLAEKTRITPNQMTVLSFVVGTFSGAAFFFHQSIIGGVLAQIASILDGVDGDLAVLTGKASMFGGFLDSVLDRYSDSAIIFGLAFDAYASNVGLNYVLIISAAALFGSLMTSYSRAKAESLNVVFKTGISGYAANRDVRLFIVMIGGILSQAYITLIVLAIITNLVVANRIWDAKKLIFTHK